MTRGVPATPPVEEVAAVTQRLAVLLSAGVSPVSAWAYLLPPPSEPSETPGVGPRRRSADAVQDDTSRSVVEAAARAGPRGENVADAIAHQAQLIGAPVGTAWLALAAAWALATTAGAPLAACLRQLAGSFRDAGQVQRDVQVALAGPTATARLVMGLPVVGIVFGALMGFDMLGTLLTTAPGLLCLAAGAVLMLGGHRWNARLIRKAQVLDAAPGLMLELTAIALSGGSSVAHARDLVRAVEKRYRPGGGGWSANGSTPTGAGVADEAIARVLDLSARAGIPAAELLRSEAEQQRRDARALGQRKAATLSVALMVPLAVCVLPAFMLVGVVPLLLSVVSSTMSTF